MSTRMTGWLTRSGARLARAPWATRRIGVAAAALIAIAAVAWWASGARSARTGAARDQARRTSAAGGAHDSMSGLESGGGDRTAGGSVHVTADQIRHFGITFGIVAERQLESRIRTAGTVTVDETRLAQVAPRFGGFVERLYVNATGQPVRRGQPLMDVYSPELLASEQELLVARDLERGIGASPAPGGHAPAPDLVAAATRRLRLWEISETQIAEILRTGEARRTLTLYAPASGIVLEKNVVLGQAFQPGQMLYTIVNLSDVWVDAELRELDADAVRTGSPATVSLAALPGRTLGGRVAYVYPTLQAQARTVKARIVVRNAAGVLKPGMYATVEIATPSGRALTVPTSAVVRTGERSLVFVDMGGGELIPREVVLGRVAADYAEVLAGVEPGQRVVTSAQYLLDSESNLAEVMKSMLGQGGR